MRGLEFQGMGVLRVSVLAVAFIFALAIPSAPKEAFKVKWGGHIFDSPSADGKCKSQPPVLCLSNPVPLMVTLPIKDRFEYYPIALSCPSEKNDRMLELILQNKLRDKTSIRATYASNSATIVSIQFIPLAGERNMTTIDLTSEKDPEMKEYGLSLADIATALKQAVCDADEKVKAHYFAKLKANELVLEGQK